MQCTVSTYIIWNNVNVSAFIVYRLKEVSLNCFPGPPPHKKQVQYVLPNILSFLHALIRWSQWHSLRCRSAAARLLRLWDRIPQGAWMSLSCKCCMLSGRGVCDNPITCPEQSYRMGCVVVCDPETS